VAGALFRAALVANCFRGALPPVDFLAVCFVLAILVENDKTVREPMIIIHYSEDTKQMSMLAFDWLFKNGASLNPQNGSKCAQIKMLVTFTAANQKAAFIRRLVTFSAC
jgi:hypothetical protein